MLNELHARLHRPEAGWDPVPPGHVEKYAGAEWESGVREELLDLLEEWTGGLAGKTVLDLGGGPGQYSVAFALRGAQVTWHDVSARYRGIAQEKAREHGVAVRFSLGYLDEAPRILGESYDLVFNRICWNYSHADAAFARVVLSLIKPGGVGYVDTTHSAYQRQTLPANARFRAWLNDRFALKIGHPFPPHGRLAKLFLAHPLKKLLIDYSVATNDRVVFRKG